MNDKRKEYVNTRDPPARQKPIYSNINLIPQTHRTEMVFSIRYAYGDYRFQINEKKNCYHNFRWLVLRLKRTYKPYFVRYTNKSKWIERRPKQKYTQFTVLQ